MGGSETRPTWRKRRVKVEVKKIEGEVAQRERRVVKKQVTARRGQRRSRTQWEGMSERKVKDLGKVEEKGMLRMPWRVVDGKVDWEPVRRATPQPPLSLPTRPAWMAAWQMKESPR